MKRILATSVAAMAAGSAFAVFGLISDDHAEFGDFVGTYGGGSGVAISPFHVVTAAHLVPGGELRNFSVLGETYTGIHALVHPEADLAVITLDRAVPYYVPLYTGSAVGMDVMIVGYGETGTKRDDHSGYDPHTSRAYRVVSNHVAAAADFVVGGKPTNLLLADLDSADPDTEDPFSRDMLGDGGATPYEGGIAVGDSGGAWLVNTADGWQLAGISIATLTANDAPDTLSSPQMRYGFGGSGAANLTVTGYGDWVAEAVPEPGVMLGAGLGIALLARRRRKRA